MSEASYQTNVARGVTGPWSNTCLMAAYDRISDVTGISTQTYELFEAVRRNFVATTDEFGNFVAAEQVRQFANIKSRFRSELGVPIPKNIYEARVNTEGELNATLGKLSLGGFRTAVYLDVGGLHAVGVKPAGNEKYDVRSTWTPFQDELAGVDEIYEYLDLAPRQRVRQGNARKTKPAFNIIALPAESKH